MQVDCARSMVSMQPSRVQDMSTADQQASEPAWAAWSTVQLLDLPMNQLGVSLAGAFLSDRIQQLYAELAARRLRFRSPAWVSNESVTPDRGAGICLPFYLARPRPAKM